MTAAERFGRPHILCRMVDGPRNETSLCEFPRGPGGRFLLFRSCDEEVQRAYLSAAGQRFPVVYDGKALEAYLPFPEGIAFSRFERETEPDFAGRRQVCLSLLEGAVGDRVPPELLMRMLKAENIVMAREGARLAYVLDFSVEASAGEAYAGLAKLCFSILNASAGLTPENSERFPPEYQLLWRRSAAGEYRSADQLCRDLHALPGECGPRQAVRSLLRNPDRGKRLFGRAAAVLVALLAVLAAYCTVGAVLRAGEQPAGEVNQQQTEITRIGDQELSGDG